MIVSHTTLRPGRPSSGPLDAPAGSAGSRRRRLLTAHQARRGDEGGYIVVLVVSMLVLLLLMTAISVDVGSWYNRSTKAQRAADASAMAAVTELAKQKKAGATTAAARTAATNVAIAVARDNSFDAAKSDYTVTVTFSTGTGGADNVQVEIKQRNLPLFFAGLFTHGVSVTRRATAGVSTCAAVCDQSMILKQAYASAVDTAVGGDGWQPVLADPYIFNLYHHDSGATLYCVNKLTNAKSAGTYPVEAYTGMVTSYTPKLSAYGTRVYFVVQTATSTGLGCWDGATGTRCPGFATPKLLAAYKVNPDKNAGTRIDGPETIRTKLWMYGDDNNMYCYNLLTDAMCAGYPKASSLKSSRNMKLTTAAAGFAGGVDGDGGIQFDMLVHPDGRIFTSLQPTTDTLGWLSCWDTNTDAACASFTNTSVTAGKPLLFMMYDATGTPTGLCARAAKRGGGSGSGQHCVTLTGAAKANEVTFTFDGSSGQAEATAVASNGHTYTYFPMTGSSTAKCWDWTTHAACSIAAPNWSSFSDYGYFYDGGKCILALGHDGKEWSFGVDDGQYPCKGAPAGAVARFVPCKCADTVTNRWTSISFKQTTNLSDFTKFLVKVTLPDGSTFFEGDLVLLGRDTIDLSVLNTMTPMPAYIDVTLDVAVVAGRESTVYAGTSGVALASGVVPTLIN